MAVSRLFLIAASALAGLAIPVAHSQDKDAVSTQSVREPGPPKPMGPPKPWKEVRGFGRVLDLSKPPVVIDEPGLYAIQHSWLFPQATTFVVPELIQITADDVTLDLHGFTISTEISGPPPSTLFVITGNSAEIRNGGIDAPDIDAAVHSTGHGAWLHHLSVDSEERGMTFEGDGATISDSQIVGVIRLAGGSNVERNTLRAFGGAVVSLTANGNRVVDNQLFPYRADSGVAIRGNGNVVANNVMDVTEAPVHAGFRVDGDHNVLRGNIVLGGPLVRTIWLTSGTANTLDGNIAPPPAPDPTSAGGVARVGMEFTADGNYYGNNRMAAQVPFALGGTVQTNWGGNVGY